MAYFVPPHMRAAKWRIQRHSFELVPADEFVASDMERALHIPGTFFYVKYTHVLFTI
jgi:hypothetical protein